MRSSWFSELREYAPNLATVSTPNDFDLVVGCSSRLEILWKTEPRVPVFVSNDPRNDIDHKIKSDGISDEHVTSAQYKPHPMERSFTIHLENGGANQAGCTDQGLQNIEPDDEGGYVHYGCAEHFKGLCRMSAGATKAESDSFVLYSSVKPFLFEVR